MKTRSVILWGCSAVILVAALFIINRYIDHHRPEWLQGTIACTTYRASSKLAGRILEVRVSEGDWVEKGSLLYLLATPELEAKLQQVEAAEAAASALDRKVVRGARSQQRQEALSGWQRSRAALELAQKSYERINRLYKEGVSTAQQYDEAKAAWESAVALEQAAHAQYELVLAGAEKEEREAAAAQVRQAAGAVAEVESYLRDAAVYAPITGEVSTLQAEPGELVGSGYPVVVLLDLEEQWAEFNISEELLLHFGVGERFRGDLPALRRSAEFEVSFVSAEADYASRSSNRASGGYEIRTFRIKARPTEAIAGLRPGMSVLVDWQAVNR